jgi:hypothetical protein
LLEEVQLDDNCIAHITFRRMNITLIKNFLLMIVLLMVMEGFIVHAKTLVLIQPKIVIIQFGRRFE